MKNWRRIIYVGLVVFSVLVFSFHYFVSGQAVYGDGIGYYSHLHSWVIDRDWDYTNEYKHLYDHEHNNSDLIAESPAVQIVPTTKEGKAENFYGTGVAVLLLPFYFLAHILSNLLNIFGAHVPTTGYGDIYQVISGIGAIFYAICGVRILEKLIYRVTNSEETGLVSSVSIFLTTSLLYYGSFDVLNSHFASFFLTSAFFYFFFTKECGQLWLGLIAGLMAITRIQDSMIVFIWLIDLISRGKNRGRSFVNFATGLSFGLVPLMIHWSIVFGNPLKHTYLRGLVQKYEFGGSVDFLGSLFNPVTGLLVRTPILMSLLGYFVYLLFKNKAREIIYPFLFFLIQYVIITIQGGWAAAAYGGRMYMSSLPFFGLLLGLFYQGLSQKKRQWARIILCFLMFLNMVSVGVFVLRDKGTEGGGLGTEQRTLLRVKQLLGK